MESGVLPVGARLRAWRKAQNRTLREVAAACKLDPSDLSRIETGKKRPREDVVSALVQELGLTMVRFYAELPPDPPPGQE